MDAAMFVVGYSYQISLTAGNPFINHINTSIFFSYSITYISEPTQNKKIILVLRKDDWNFGGKLAKVWVGLCYLGAKF